MYTKVGDAGGGPGGAWRASHAMLWGKGGYATLENRERSVQTEGHTFHGYGRLWWR